jgi:hypothetical protein
MFVANLLSDLSTYKTQKTEQDDTSLLDAPATLKAHVLSTVFEISRLSIGCAGSLMATSRYWCSWLARLYELLLGDTAATLTLVYNTMVINGLIELLM